MLRELGMVGLGGEILSVLDIFLKKRDVECAPIAERNFSKICSISVIVYNDTVVGVNRFLQVRLHFLVALFQPEAQFAGKKIPVPLEVIFYSAFR